MLNKTQTIASLIGSVLLISACNTGTDSGQLVLSRPNLTLASYEQEAAKCDEYVSSKGATDGQKTGGVVAALLLGGIVGGIATAEAHKQSEYRLFEECMYDKGFQLIELPIEFYDLELKEDQSYDIRKASVSLLEAGKLEELQVWARASAINTKASYAKYLDAYPNGFFADKARLGPQQPK